MPTAHSDAVGNGALARRCSWSAHRVETMAIMPTRWRSGARSTAFGLLSWSRLDRRDESVLPQSVAAPLRVHWRSSFASRFNPRRRPFLVEQESLVKLGDFQIVMLAMRDHLAKVIENSGPVVEVRMPC